MCISIGPANFSDTLIYSGVVRHNNETRHVIGYQNKVQSLSSGPNAMILPIPTEEDIGPDNIVDTKGFSNCLSPYNSYVEGLYRTKGMTRSVGNDNLYGASVAGFKVFESGSYTIALASKASALIKALEQVPEHKRPKISFQMISFFASHYKGWPIAICCFDNSDEIKAEPLLWHFKPKFKDHLFAPAIDAHDGDAPDLNKPVRRNHSIVYGMLTGENNLGEPHSVPEDKRWLFSKSARGIKIDTMDTNRDYIIEIDKLKDYSHNAPIKMESFL